MTKKKIYIDIGMVIGGIVLLFILKGNPWPIGMYFFLYVCSAIGSLIGLYCCRRLLKSFIIAVLITTLLLSSGLIISDIFIERVDVLFEYLMWLFLILFFLPLYGLAGTLSMFPLINITINRLRTKE